MCIQLSYWQCIPTQRYCNGNMLSITIAGNGFRHDSLNLMNAAKFFQENYMYNTTLRFSFRFFSNNIDSHSHTTNCCNLFILFAPSNANISHFPSENLFKT